jgi:hypothetical protein
MLAMADGASDVIAHYEDDVGPLRLRGCWHGFTDYYADASCTAGRANFIIGELIRTGLTRPLPSMQLDVTRHE